MRYWKRVNEQGKTTTVESYSHSLDIEGATEIAEIEFRQYMDSLPKPVPNPPCSIHIAKIVNINVDLTRPVKVAREWNGEIIQHDCLVTENLKDQYLQGDVQMGDYVLVDCQCEAEEVYIVIGKIFKSW